MADFRILEKKRSSKSRLIKSLRATEADPHPEGFCKKDFKFTLYTMSHNSFPKFIITRFKLKNNKK